MFLRRREANEAEQASPSPLTTVRDIVEIVAIVAAGIWAFYTFVYENQIKPANSAPETQIESSLTRLGQHDGLIAVRSKIVIKNVGVSDVWFYGIAETVLASTVRLHSARASPLATNGPTRLIEAAWSTSRPIRVFAYAKLMKLADPSATSTIDLRPGQTVPIDRLFYIPDGRFDQLTLNVSTLFSAQARPIPCKFEIVNEALHVVPSSHESVDGTDGVTGTLSLWR